MFKRYLLALDERGLPQRLVRWATRKRSRSQLAEYLFPHSSGTHAVTLTVTTPLISHKDLFDGVVPSQFGSWREFRVRNTLLQGHIAVAMLKDTRSDTEFALVVPIHADFSVRRFRAAKTLRLTCEAERSRLVTVREPNGYLLAAGTLEFVQQAAFSEELR